MPTLFKRAFWSCLIALSIGPLSGCAYLSQLRHTYGDEALPAHHFAFRDGGQAMYFSFDKRLPFSADQPVATYLFVVAGSDCTSMKYFLPHYFRGLDGESGPVRVFILQKRHIVERTWGRFSGCSEDFIRADHPSRWIADQLEFIRAQLAQARVIGAAPLRIAILGISEGGDIIPVLAQQISAVTHVAILANGGMDPIEAYHLQAKKHGFDHALVALDGLRYTPIDPDAAEHHIGGRSWRYWAELQEIRHSENLLGLTMPVLIAMGEADQAVPIESAWHIRDCFLRHAKTNLTLITYPDADHALQRGNYMVLPDFWRAFDFWLKK